MKPNNGATQLSEPDPYATRAPSPDSLEMMALASDAAAEEVSRVRSVTREEFERALVECGFLDAQGLRTILEDMAADNFPTEVEDLARVLIKLRKLTRYQAAALYQGKARSLLIGPYVVLDRLGSGGMGIVFKARKREGGPEVALKLLPPSASKHPRAVLRFRREAQIMEKLDHPNIVSSHDIGEYNGVHYLVMDYVEGQDLDKIVRSRGPMKLPRAIDCIIQAARGLAAAHDRGIVHRDIKPANLLLDSKGNVRVLDLGLARITEDDDTWQGTSKKPNLTASGIIMGTVDFLSPEQSDDSKRADHRADIYSLGCTLHYLLAGRPPYSGESIMQRLIAHHHKEIPSLREARPEVTPEIDAIFRKMMAKTSEARPQSMLEVLESLETAQKSLSVSKGLRVFDDAGPPRASASESKIGPSPSSSSSEDTESDDLMSFIRSELFEPEPGETLQNLSLIPVRKSKKGRKRFGSVDLVVRGLVAAAAIAVLLWFIPRISFTSPTASSKSPKVVVVSKPDVPQIVEAPKPKVELTPTPKPEVPKVVEKSDPGPPPGPSLLEELMRPPPPPPYGPPGLFPPPPPRERGPASKRGQPPQGPGPF